GVVDAVDGTLLTVRFDQAQAFVPNATAPTLRVRRVGSLGHQVQSFLGNWADPTRVLNDIPTVQDLVQRLADYAGVDPDAIGLTVPGAGTDRVLQITPQFKPDPLTFSRTLDFGDRVAGLKVDAAGTVDVTVAASFRIPLGIRLASGLDIDQRFFIVADATPEVTLHVTAALDNPNVQASIGFLDVRLQEDPAVTPNKGITFARDLTGTLRPPATAPADGHIPLDELRPSDLTRVFDAAIDARFAIDGLQATADVGGTALGSLTISLDGESGPNAPGHVTSLSQLVNLPGAIVVNGAANFTNFNNITPEIILAPLEPLLNRLQ